VSLNGAHFRDEREEEKRNMGSRQKLRLGTFQTHSDAAMACKDASSETRSSGKEFFGEGEKGGKKSFICRAQRGAAEIGTRKRLDVAARRALPEKGEGKRTRYESRSDYIHLVHRGDLAGGMSPRQHEVSEHLKATVRMFVNPSPARTRRSKRKI